MDDLDKRILTELGQNSRLSYRQLAEKFKHSTTTISNRISDLEKKGFIKKYTLQVDHEKLGYNITAIINVTVTRELSEMEVFISQMPGVVAVYDVTGTYDVVVIAKVKNTSELSLLVKKMLDHDYIDRTNTQVVLNIVKEEFTVLPLDINGDDKE